MNTVQLISDTIFGMWPTTYIDSAF